VAVGAGFTDLAAPPAGAETVTPAPSEFPMTMPTSGMVESLVGGGCSSGRSHPGVDISNLATSTATEIYAAYPGTAYAINKGDGYGLRVEIVHPYEGGYYLTRYAHLSQAFVSADGQPVEQGDLIGLMGRSGSATGVHLHFEVRQGTAPGSDVPVDINEGFRPCRNLVSCGPADPRRPRAAHVDPASRRLRRHGHRGARHRCRVPRCRRWCAPERERPAVDGAEAPCMISAMAWTSARRTAGVDGRRGLGARGSGGTGPARRSRVVV
jgi:murein DD-endopeptidase MepM/ murein hydrolase activator NlpD